MQPAVSEAGGVQIADRLAARRAEIEQITLSRAYGIAEPPDNAELDYLHGLRQAVSAAIEFGLQVLSHSQDRPPRVPAALLVQARLAARNGVALDVVLRRYFSGYTLFTNFVLEEIQRASTTAHPEPRGLLRCKTSQFDRLVSVICEEYQREAEAARRSTLQPQTRLVERLLAGEVVSPASLAYEIDTHWHLGLVCSDATDRFEALRRVGDRLDCRLLFVRRRSDPSWAWLGSRRGLEVKEVRAAIETELGKARIALGHPGFGLSGWQLSHRQAKAVWPLVQRNPRRVLDYAKAGLVASLAKDEVATASLHQIYLAPLAGGRANGDDLKDAVRAYLRAGRNITSAAAALGVNRQTLRTRLRVVEEKIGRSLDGCGAEMEIALRLDRAFF